MAEVPERKRPDLSGSGRRSASSSSASPPDPLRTVSHLLRKQRAFHRRDHWAAAELRRMTRPPAWRRPLVRKSLPICIYRSTLVGGGGTRGARRIVGVVWAGRPEIDERRRRPGLGGALLEERGQLRHHLGCIGFGPRPE